MAESGSDKEEEGGEASHFEKLASTFWKQYECKNCSDEGFTSDDNESTDTEDEEGGRLKANAKTWLHTKLDSEEDGDLSSTSDSAHESEDFNWNPMVTDFHSILNLKDGRTDDSDEPQFKLLGEKVPEMNQCPFDNGQGGCFKAKCFKTHRKPNDLADPPPFIHENRNFNFRDLPSKRRPHGPGKIFWGYVTHAVSPDEFYVLPDWDFRCACSMDPKVSKTFKSRVQYPEHFHTGKVAYDEMQLDLQGYMRNHRLEVLQNLKYGFAQLVICSTEQYGYARGVVLEDIFHGESETAAPAVSVYLIDIGETLKIPYISVFAIPESFTSTQPLVYKCSMFAVTSVGFCYSPRAREFFARLLVKNKVKTRIHLMSNEGSHLAPFTEAEAYVVDLVVPFKDDHIRVADILQKFGLAIQFNLLKTRPLLLNAGTISMSEALVLGQKPASKPTQDFLLKEATAKMKKRAQNTPKSTVDVEAALQNDKNVLERQSKKGTPEEIVDRDVPESITVPSTASSETSERNKEEIKKWRIEFEEAVLAQRKFKFSVD